ncbi:DegT/DnrJ/EryC1/StrS family aminotransferase [Pontibacter lucknowensis]|uniref:dTDP-4-amino-4,6-dideoxygalactose transaminase n=1 Tax=Pontibacter lucknowensis TaxID=1077936 RepID=A0A1N7ASS4_9BACT|nr:DegT/DnrJ/EryC1/StrS family aminotransferase [Pontibacter lucknowensis]SIR42115.1 dTDP-4-amino-4,6-dideoxygalactose transaminase [Pontibacter lucknowensis]
MNIQMVDLKGQYHAIKSEIDTAINDVIESSAFINGPAVSQFAKELAAYNKVAYVVPCANGTDALQLAMMALDLVPGDEVIVPSFTYVATAEVIALLGLTPVFVDVNPSDFLVSPTKIKESITPKTKAIVPVHLFGQCADMESIMAIAREHGLYVIEDTAQAIGAVYTFKDGTTKKAGTMGDIGTTSFFPSKNLGCYGDGGAMFTNDEQLATRLKMIANHGQRVKYYHDIIGVNSRLDTVQAAILRVKLPHLDQYSANRNRSAEYYDKALGHYKSIVTPVRVESSTHVFHQYTLKCIGFDREELKAFLQQKSIPSMVYYPVPLHLQKGYAQYGFATGSFPVSEQLADQVLSLPIHTEQTEEELSYIVENVKDFLHTKGLN